MELFTILQKKPKKTLEFVFPHMSAWRMTQIIDEIIFWNQLIISVPDYFILYNKAAPQEWVVIKKWKTKPRSAFLIIQI